MFGAEHINQWKRLDYTSVIVLMIFISISKLFSIIEIEND